MKQAPPSAAEAGFEDLSTTRRKLSAQAAMNAQLEVEHLKKLLSAQEAAKVHAQSAAADIHKQLRMFESENSRIRADLRKTQDLLSFAKQEHSIELRIASDREGSVRNELLEARTQAGKAMESVAGYRKKGALVLVGVVLPALIWAGVNRWHTGGSVAPDDTQAAEVAPAAVTERPHPASSSSPKPAAKDFAGAVGRLDDALAGFGSEKPEAVLTRVRLQNAARGISVCAFAWHNGQVSLELGAGAPMDIDKAMTQCADAVEKSASAVSRK